MYLVVLCFCEYKSTMRSDFSEKENGMQIEQISNYMAKAGFSRAFVNSQRVRVLLQKKDQRAYVVVLVDCKKFEDMNLGKYEDMLRGIRSSLYDYEFSEIHMLGVLCTEDPESVKNLISGFGDHWIVDIVKRQLLIYENQILSFGDAKEVIENALIFGDEEVVKELQRKQNAKQLFKNMYVTMLMILLNTLIYTVLDLVLEEKDTMFILEHGVLKLSAMHGIWQYRVLSNIFLHLGIEHLLNSMFLLLAMGYWVEKNMEKWKYISIYLGSGMVGSIVAIYYSIFEHQNYGIIAGAVCSVFGLLGALLWMMLYYRGRGVGVSWLEVLFLIGMLFYLGNDGVAMENAAHVGATLAGFIMGACLIRKEEKEAVS